MYGDAAHRLRLASILWKWVPHPTQRKWMLCDAPVKVAACGRRWGKTEAAAVDAAAAAILWRGSNQIIVSPSYDQSRLITEAVERLFARRASLWRRCKVVKTPYPRITFDRSVISARTADEDGRNLRGQSADRVIVDEAAYVRESVIAEVISPMLADRNGKLVLVSTPFGRNHFYRAYLRGQNRPNRRYASFRFPSVANPHISRSYIESQRATLSARQFAAEYEAEFIEDASTVFPASDIERAVMGEREPEGDLVVGGLDWARYSDYTAIVAMAGGVVVAVDRFNNVGWKTQIDRVASFLDVNRVSIVLADQTSIGDPLLEQLADRLRERRMETRLEGFVFTAPSKRELIEGLAMGFAHGRICLPGDERLISELTYFEYDLTESGHVRMNARYGFHDDLVIALALAWRLAGAFGSPTRPLTSGTRLAAGGW